MSDMDQAYADMLDKALFWYADSTAQYRIDCFLHSAQLCNFWTEEERVQIRAALEAMDPMDVMKVLPPYEVL